MLRIYFDNYCFKRTFDDQSQIRIRLESEAKLFIQQNILNKKLTLVWSYMLDFENSVNPFDERKIAIARWRENAAVIINQTTRIVRRAHRIAKRRIAAKDALHVACAIEGKCDWFLSADDILLKQLSGFRKIASANPVEFVRLWEPLK